MISEENLENPFKRGTLGWEEMSTLRPARFEADTQGTGLVTAPSVPPCVSCWGGAARLSFLPDNSCFRQMTDQELTRQGPFQDLTVVTLHPSHGPVGQGQGAVLISEEQPERGVCDRTAPASCPLLLPYTGVRAFQGNKENREHTGQLV